MLHDVFISYARDDRAEATRYYEFLKGAGVDVWYDQLAEKKASVVDEIGTALRRSSFVLLLWSKHAYGADFVHREIMLAEELGKKVIPVRLDSKPFTFGVRLVLTGTKPIDGRRAFPTVELAATAERIAPPPTITKAPVFLLLNMKGGVGKTTLAANIAGTFHAGGKSVLLVDLDAQANLSNLLMSEQQYVESVSVDRSVISCFENSLANGETASAADRLLEIQASGPIPLPTRLAFNLRNPLTSKRFDLIVGQFELFKFSLVNNYPSIPPCRNRFKEFIEMAQRQYDVVILDAAPSNSFLTECAIEAATNIIAPTTPDKYALRGIQAIFRLMSEGLRLLTPKPVHVILNNVPAEVTLAESAVGDAYRHLLMDVRVRDSQFFKVRNADPRVRVRDPLGELAFARGGQEVKTTLRRICAELERRNGAQSRDLAA